MAKAKTFDFIDTETFTSSFNSESFISLLKIIKNNGLSKMKSKILIY